MNIIDPLLEEHKVIGSTLAVFKAELEKIAEQRRVDPISIDMSIDFVRTYIDLVHHGKEENILFRELGKKNLAAEHSALMNELLLEHKYSRTIVGRWMGATERYFDGEDNAEEIGGCLQELIEFYPQHIAKENKHFFIPVLEYFSQEEQNRMIQEFEVFDDKILHWKYRKVETALEERIDDIRTGSRPWPAAFT
jgi:hemerythrin-like domain-containing protein